MHLARWGGIRIGNMHNPAHQTINPGAPNRLGPIKEPLHGNVDSIQFLRFVAASLVVFWHSIEALNQHIPGTISKTILQNGLLGASGVHIFFVISGFIMVYSSFYRNNDGHFSFSKFLSRRAIRIYPIYFIYCGLYIYFYHNFLGAPLLSFGELIGSLLLLPGYSARIIGPGWTLAYEVYFYLCFSIAMIVGLKKGIRALTVFFLASIALRLAVDTGSQAIFVFTNSLLIEFLLGAWIGYAVVSEVRVGDLPARLMLALAFAGFLAGIIFGFNRLPAVLMWGVPSALLVAGSVFSELNGRIPTLIRKYSFLGDSSYSLYLIHVVLIDIVIVLAINTGDWITAYAQHVGTLGMILACCVITAYCIAVALFLYEVVERRLVGRLRDFFRRKSIVAPTSQKEVI
jgi:exopolysaccharide production protein ExoZ